ncbi:uncharacterized protein MELLADRAFT_106806 [Melampsora larici-populina 98AG31]|uniref:Secreted protein n=1 Tax=Melampsora larici-populina (strain 98AG31 / pathotype 3-4-7) TaxID=747676 RepID=F4RMP7_MELLP|nr:uncharacterized protein MELLADRAFT_106806 [Melampsora larici-populina 98AG31]EGG06146.1 hypothetical protein MELLADRAFT_106806 [Melampsora larici-populina 98AG31]
MTQKAWRISSCTLLIAAFWSCHFVRPSAISVTDSNTPRLLRRNLGSREEEAASIIKIPELEIVVENPGFQPPRTVYDNAIKSKLTHLDRPKFEYQLIQRPPTHRHPSTEWWSFWQFFTGQTFQSVVQELRDYWFTAWSSPLHRFAKDLVSSAPKINRHYFRSNPAELLLLAQEDHYDTFNRQVGTTLSDAQRDLSRERTVELIPRFLNILVHGEKYFKKPRAQSINEDFYRELSGTVLEVKNRLPREEGSNSPSEGYAKAIHQVLYRMLEGLEGLPELSQKDYYWHLAKLQDVTTQELLDVLDPQKVPSGKTQEEYHIIIAALDQALGKFNLQRSLFDLTTSNFLLMRLNTGNLNRGLLWLSTLPYNANISPNVFKAIKSEWRRFTFDIPFAQEVEAFQDGLMHIVWQDEHPLSSKIWSNEESRLEKIASRTMVFSDTLTRRIWWRQFQPEGNSVEPLDQIPTRHVNRVLSTIDGLILKYDPQKLKSKQLIPKRQSPWEPLMDRFHSILSSTSS